MAENGVTLAMLEGAGPPANGAQIGRCVLDTGEDDLVSCA
jgi:hypothetical protein